MKGWTVESITPEGTMRLADLPDPVVGPGQYVVQVEAAGLNFLDVLMPKGLYQTKPQLPFTPGIESVGRIIEVGEGASLPVGTRVVSNGQGAYAERVLVKASGCNAIPDDIPAAEAVSLFGVVYGTAWHALHNRALLQPGETVLVHAGAGGVGSATVQVAVAHGCRVIATAGGAAKVAVAREMGAELAIDYTTEDWVETVRSYTEGKGCAVIFDPVGGDVGEKSLRCLGWHGRYLVIGFAGGPIPKLPANRFLLKESSAVGVFWGAAMGNDPALRPRVHAALLALYRAGKVKPLVPGRFPLDQAEAAIASLASRGSVGKVVLQVS
ncbi:NADPH:quinone oxidoreductase family protein [Acidisphaera sp. L21]|uniref:NADPH:quinone oxidoreductase family protein n=1 Tax=Acidisphaera sp. L21 TaxID=1641851 RepID=UPI001C2081B4|nr:NADPH:quinone oxidoreductase family protein [Acidisphaera sp. L21]